MHLFRYIAILLLLGATGCSAQSAPANDPALNRRLEVQLRSRFTRIPSDAKLEFGPRRASEMAGFDIMPVTIARGEMRSTLEFLLSKDNSTLVIEKLQITPLPSEKIDVAGRPVRGNSNAKVTIVNFDDFQCPYCREMHNRLTQDVLPAYGDKVKVIYKDYPLVSIHPWATRAHVNANCLAEQNADAFWAYADHVHDNLNAFNKNDKGEKRTLAEQHMRLDASALDIGKKKNVDESRLKACLQKQDDSVVKRAMKEGEQLEIDSTPTLFVNGERVSGAVPIDDFRAIIDRALVAAGEQPPPRPSSGSPAPTK